MLAVVALYVVAVQDLTCPEGQFAERDECVRCQPGKYRQDQTEVVTCLIRMDPETVIVNNGVQHANTLVQHTAVTDNLPDYAWGTLGAPECPMNYHPIFTETKCKLAAAALKFEEPEGPVLSFLQPAQNAWSSSTVNFVQSDIQVAENSGKGALGCVHNATQQNVILNDAQNGRMKHQHDVLLCGKMRAFEAKFEPAVDANLIVEVQHVGNTQSYCGAASVIVSCTSSIVESAYNTFAASPDTCNTVYAMCKSGRGGGQATRRKAPCSRAVQVLHTQRARENVPTVVADNTKTRKPNWSVRVNCARLASLLRPSHTLSLSIAPIVHPASTQAYLGLRCAAVLHARRVHITATARFRSMCARHAKRANINTRWARPHA